MEWTLDPKALQGHSVAAVPMPQAEARQTSAPLANLTAGRLMLPENARRGKRTPGRNTATAAAFIGLASKFLHGQAQDDSKEWPTTMTQVPLFNALASKRDVALTPEVGYA
jgi:hypothetical protein